MALALDITLTAISMTEVGQTPPNHRFIANLNFKLTPKTLIGYRRDKCIVWLKGDHQVVGLRLEVVRKYYGESLLFAHPINHVIRLKVPR